MSKATALADAQQLRTALLDHGVKAVSIELQAGRGPDADPWHGKAYRAVMSHHIASRPSQGLTPGLALVKAGRADLPGPLCNGYGGYDLVARIITMGWANHPGAGGPWFVPGGTIPKDGARPYAFGWEFEGGYEAYTDKMIDFMARCQAGNLDWLGEPVEAHGEHKTWAPARKVDRIGFTTTSGRDAIRRVLATTPTVPTTPAQEADMPLTTADLDAIEHRIRKAQWLDHNGQAVSVEKLLASASRAGNELPGYGARIEDTQTRVIAAQNTLAALAQGLTPQTLAAALRPAVEEAVAEALADVEGAPAEIITDKVAAGLAARLIS